MLHQAVNIGRGYAVGGWVGGSLSSTSFITLFILLGSAEAATVLARRLVVAHSATRASRELHSRALHATLAAPCAWFDSHPVGMVQSRLMKDMERVDGNLPDDVHAVVSFSLSVLSVAVVIGLNTPVALLVLLATIGPYCYSMRLWVQPAMVSLNRLVASSRAPVLAHTMEALRGVPVIHA